MSTRALLGPSAVCRRVHNVLIALLYSIQNVVLFTNSSGCVFVLMIMDWKHSWIVARRYPCIRL
jgi:hypothetical protein